MARHTHIKQPTKIPQLNVAYSRLFIGTLIGYLARLLTFLARQLMSRCKQLYRVKVVRL